MPRLKDFPRSLNPLQPQDSTAPKPAHNPDFERTNLFPGVWIVFIYNGHITKELVRQFFLDSLGVDLVDDRISLGPTKCVVSFDKTHIAALLAWLLEGYTGQNPLRIRLAPYS